jgi:hypothetical protein
MERAAKLFASKRPLSNHLSSRRSGKIVLTGERRQADVERA